MIRTASVAASILFASAAIPIAVGALAQSPPMPATMPPEALTQPGQSAFAALGEVTAMLMADPTTDWSKVGIAALRSHLVDMDNVFLRSQVAARDVPGGARFDVTGDSSTAASIQRMAGEHFAAMGAGEWKVAVRPLPNGEQLTVTTAKPVDVPKIRALGFYGLMALGDHHKRHHLMLARSGSMGH